MIARLMNNGRPVYVDGDDVSAIYEFERRAFSYAGSKGPLPQRRIAAEVWMKAGGHLVIELSADEIAKAIGWAGKGTV